MQGTKGTESGGRKERRGRRVGDARNARDGEWGTQGTQGTESEGRKERRGQRERNARNAGDGE